MAITVCYDELDSWRFSDATFGMYSVYAVADEVMWMDATTPSIVQTVGVIDLWRWSDASTVNTPFDQIADAWRWGESVRTIQTTGLLDAMFWQDAVQVIATGTTLDAWRFSDGSTTSTFTTSHTDNWRWQDYSTGGINADTLDAFGWSDQLSEPQTKSNTLDAWQFTDGATLGESSLVLLDQWHWFDGALAANSVLSLVDTWHWQDNPAAMQVTAIGQLLEEFYWQDAPQTTNKHRAWVSHLMTFAASMWQDLPYSSSATGLMAGASGVYASSNNKATAILKSGVHDFGKAEQKTIGSVYAGTNSQNESMTLSVKTDLQPVYDYPADTYGTGNARFKTGRGLRGRHFQFTLTGKAAVSELAIELATTSRRVK